MIPCVHLFRDFTEKTRILKIFLMTKNEFGFIEDWIIYHGTLFVFGNLYIVDGSDRDEIFEVYDRYTPKGLNVFHTKANLNEMSQVLTNYIHENNGIDNFFIKLDTDKFLANVVPFHPCHSGKVLPLVRIENYRINELPVTEKKYKVSILAVSVPKSLKILDRPIMSDKFSSLFYS